jgi:phosphoglycerol transferase
MSLHKTLKAQSTVYLYSIREYKNAITTYISVFFSAIFGAVWVHGVSPSDLKYPWGVFESDISGVYAFAQAAGDSWTNTINYSMGAPFDADFSKVIPVDDLHLAFIRILAHLTGNSFVAVNVYYLLTFGITAIAFLYLAEHFSLRSFIAIPLSLSYSWLPYHFSRMHVGHLFLSAYYMVPIGFVILSRLYQYVSGDRDHFFPSRYSHKILFLSGIFLVGASGTYYGLFFFLLTSSLLVVIVSIRVSTQMLKKFSCTMIVAFLFVAAPYSRSILARIGGLTSYASRSPDESLQFGGSISRLLIPWGTWLPQKLKPAVSLMEFEWNAIPILGVLGIWALLGIGVLSIVSHTTVVKTLDRSIIYFFVWSLLLYVSGGLGYVFALSIDPSFRAWNRISVLITTLALLCLGSLLSNIKSVSMLRVLSPLILISAIASQLIPLSSVGIGNEPNEASRVTFNALEEDAEKIQRELRPGCSVLQLPIMVSPEGGQVGDVGNGEHYWLPLLTDNLSWSYGAGKGTLQGKFWEPYAGGDPSLAINKAKGLGFCAVLVNFQGHQDRDTLVSILGKPIFENLQTGNSLFRI